MDVYALKLTDHHLAPSQQQVLQVGTKELIPA